MSIEISGYSSDGLSKMHQAVLDSLKRDEETPEGQEKPYGVREYSDWKQWSDALEKELSSRGVAFEPVPW